MMRMPQLLLVWLSLHPLPLHPPRLQTLAPLVRQSAPAIHFPFWYRPRALLANAQACDRAQSKQQPTVPPRAQSFSPYLILVNDVFRNGTYPVPLNEMMMTLSLQIQHSVAPIRIP